MRTKVSKTIKAPKASKIPKAPKVPIWYSLRNVRDQLIPDEILGAVEDTYADAGRTLEGQGKVTEFHIDLPGMIMADRAWETFKLPGMDLKIPLTDVRYFYEELCSYKGHMCPDGTVVYVLKGWMAKVWLSGELKKVLLGLMRAQMASIDTKAATELEEFKRRLSGANVLCTKVHRPLDKRT